MKSISIDQISAVNPAAIELKQKPINQGMKLTSVLPPAFAKPDSLTFISEVEFYDQALANGAPAMVISEKCYLQIQAKIPAALAVWTTKNIQLAMSLLLPLFDKVADTLSAGVHPTAAVHPTAQVSPTAHIGAYAVIEAHAVVGGHTVIFPHVYVGPYCEIGNNCRLAPHVTVGSDGFGYFTDKNLVHHRIPQIGKVVIEDGCEFGAHCAIDRATLTETRIKRGSKFDNFCHIAHNVQIGENAMITAGFIVAGSTIIGKNLMTSGGTHVLGHLNIADNVVLGPRSGVLQSIDSPGVYSGYPLEPYKESVKTLLSIPHVKKLRKQVSHILKHLNLKEEDN
jgi:UDP-3-O-[3-hydroxymyristoyl] glucosamine N-acyltransferase